MGSYSRILNLVLLWLTTIASVVGILPQFHCVCASGTSSRGIVFSPLNPFGCCVGPCCVIQNENESSLAVGGRKTATQSRSCCLKSAEWKRISPKDTDTKLVQKGCKKELAAVQSTIASPLENHVGRVDFQVALRPFTFPIRHNDFVPPNDGYTHPPGSFECRPPIDLVISLCHLVI